MGTPEKETILLEFTEETNQSKYFQHVFALCMSKLATIFFSAQNSKQAI